MRAPRGAKGAARGFTVCTEKSGVAMKKGVVCGAWFAGVIWLGLVLGASGNAWAASPTLETTLVPSDGVNGDWFGSAVALDGNTAVVGAPYKGGENVIGSWAASWH